MQKPNKLLPGDSIYLVSPSFGCTMEPYKTRLLTSIEVFKSLEYKVILGENIFKQNGLLSSTKEECGAEINKAFESEAKVILSVGGGEVMCEILPFIDFSKIKKPIWFVGFSDNANLTYTLPTLCDIEAIYAPCAGDYAIYPFQEDAEATMNMLTETKNSFTGYKKWEIAEIKSELEPLSKYNLTEEKIIKKYNCNDFTQIHGRLLGGCIDVLMSLIGTKYDKTIEFIEKYKNDGIIWFLEACDLSVTGIRRVFHQFDEAGWFKYCKGFLIGRPCAAWKTEFFGENQYSAVLNAIEKYNVPVVMDIDIGHYSPMIPMRTGALATVDILENDIVVTYEK